MRSFDDLVRHAPHLFANFIEAPTHEALDGIHSVFWVGYRLPLGHLPY